MHADNVQLYTLAGYRQPLSMMASAITQARIALVMAVVDLLERILFAPRREAFGRVLVILILVFGIVLAAQGVLPELPPVHLPPVHLPVSPLVVEHQTPVPQLM